MLIMKTSRDAPTCPDEDRPSVLPETAAPVGMPEELVYVDDGMPGIRRRRRGDGFVYQDANGRWLRQRDRRDRVVLDRIRHLAIPPAYEDVWICPLDNGHLQATGRDARGRKQYRYHAQWHEARGSDKFARMRAFGEALPRLRRRVQRDLAPVEGAKALRRTTILASLVRLLDTTFVRIGNEEYAKANKSYGLTTLRNRHAQVQGPVVKLSFRGKSGVQHQVTLEDPKVARVIRRCQALPGQTLFQYEDEEGQCHAVGSTDVNAYLREACGESFSAKDFRTWHATVHAWSLLAPGKRTRQAEANAHELTRAEITKVLGEVASRLGNTVAVCRKSYVHPGLLACALQNEWPDDLEGSEALAVPKTGLNAAEQGLLRFLARQEGGPAGSTAAAP